MKQLSQQSTSEFFVSLHLETHFILITQEQNYFTTSDNPILLLIIKDT